MAQRTPALAEKIRGEILQDAPMSAYTSWRVGGRADTLVFPADLDDLRTVLQWCREEGAPVFILGNGTNLLVRDGGIRGVVVSLARGFSRIEERGERILAEAGASLGKLVELAAARGLAGLEFAAGIPGSVGGALFMNAGAFQGEIMDVVAAVPVLSAAGEVRVRSREEMDFSYRRLALDAGEVILAGEFRLRAGEGAAVRAKGEEIIRRRLNKHPYDLPNAGSVFKNPPEGPAGKWIEEAGMKGVRVGDAEVSVKHANFIVNRGAAKAGDILALMAQVQQRVWRQKGVRLEPEIRVWGEEP